MATVTPADDHIPPGARSVRRADEPSLSIVVASSRGRHALNKCLNLLLPSCRRANAELIVARAGGASHTAELARAYPTVRFVTAPADATLSDLRAAGLAAAAGDIVRITDDTKEPVLGGLARLASPAGARKDARL